MQVVVQRLMSGGTMVVGLLLALWLDASAAGAQPVGWVLAVLGAIGLVASFVLPAPGARNRR